MPLIHATDLDTWANTNIARDSLGELLRRLIHASVQLPNIKSIRILSHESNQLSGWDGILVCQSKVPWLPSGPSVWELGTGNNARQKIRNDFAERHGKDLPSGWDRAKTTYVAVTLRKLDDISSLEKELKAKSPWSDVRIVDAQTLEEWIEVSPSVESWLQEQGIGPPSSVYTLQRNWQGWSEKTRPRVSTQLVLAGRDKNANDLLNNLASPGAPINIQADSPEEAVEFVYSVIDSSDDLLFKENFLARSIVINNVNDTFRFQNSSSMQNIILCPPATSESLSLARCGHTIVNSLGNKSLAQSIDIRLTRSLRTDFANALVAMGMSEKEADLEARACGCSPSIWRIWNLLKHGDPGVYVPDWAKYEYRELVVPAVLLGGWSEDFEGDKEVIRSITGKNYEEYLGLLNQFVISDNPLLIKVGDAWVVSAPATAFALIINHTTNSQLKELSTITKNVFDEIDPTINLPPDERPYAGMKGIRMQHSTWLRDGLAGSLLRIAVIGQQLERNGIIPNNQSCQHYVDAIVGKLKGLREDWRLLASLRDQVPILAEVAPVPFMEALECLLQGQPENIQPIFVEGDGIWSHALHTGLLWALETLAWEPSYLGRVGVILAQLAGIDPGGKLSNRPINSLKEIFLAWHPGTSANLGQRLEALKFILERENEIGWDLLNALLPRAHQISSPSHDPIWRDFGRSQKEQLTNKIVWDTYQEYIDLAISHAEKHPDRWKTLIGIYGEISDNHQKSLEAGLIELRNSDLSEVELKEVWDALRKFVNRHKGFPDASWALAEEQLIRLESVMQLFEPTDHVDRISWLFNDYFPDIPFPRANHDAARDELNKLRDVAIESLWQAGKIEILTELINQISDTGVVAFHLFDLLNDEKVVMEAVVHTIQGTDNERFFAQCLSGKAYDKFGDSWTKLLLSKAKDLLWSSDVIVNVLLNYPESKKIFDLVKSLGREIEQTYWVKKPGWFQCTDDASLVCAIEKLKENGRALDAIALAERKWDAKDPVFIFELLDQAIEELNEAKKPNALGNIGYLIEELFDWLRGQEDVDKTELARREYAYLPLLTGALEKKNLALHELLATDPSFFIKILCDLYKPAAKTSDDNEQSKDTKLCAEFAWKMLNSWHRPPGLDNNGEVNGDKLREWIEKVRQLATQNDRLDIADQEIGKVLFYFPSDPNDSLWPHIELRKLLEDVKSKNIETGIELEQSNSRGVVQKEMYEGGKQERALARKWRENAEKLEICWPRTKAMLERIASSWETHAKWEDDQAEKGKLRFR